MNDNKRDNKLILNPVENLPHLVSNYTTSELEGFYISDKVRTAEQKKKTNILFLGREQYSILINEIYLKWAKLLNADALSMRLLSGLHAHIVTFMGVGNIGDSVLLLPTEAGGHYATSTILKRLGYRVIDMVVDYKNFCVDKKETQLLIRNLKPKFIFVDRSEGINYEDFSELTNNNSCCIYDASQYLTNIMMGTYKTPFDMGFDFLLSTLHKNFPGPQQALICAKDKNNIYWQRILSGMSSYVSNLHADNIFKAGAAIRNMELLHKYASLALENSVALEKNLIDVGLKVIQKKDNLPPTHHIWIPLKDQNCALKAQQRLEEHNLLVNYRLLPYNLGYGLRLGTTAATLQGLTPDKTHILAKLIVDIIKEEPRIKSQHVCDFINSLVPLNKNIIEEPMDNT